MHHESISQYSCMLTSMCIAPMGHHRFGQRYGVCLVPRHCPNLCRLFVSLDEAQCTMSRYTTNKKVPLEKLFGTFVQFCTTGHSSNIFVHAHNTALWSYKWGRLTHICVTKLDYHQVIIGWDMSHHSISMEFFEILMVTYKSYMFVWSTSLNIACLVIYCEQSFA